MAVADRLDVRRTRGSGGGRRRADAIDDAPEIAVADRLAVLAERDDRAVDVADLFLGQREAQCLAARLDGVAPRMAIRL